MKAEKAEIVPSRPAAKPVSLDVVFANMPAEARAQLEGARRVKERAIKKRHATSTQEGYDYWWDRFLHWCAVPASRLNIPQVAPVTLEQLQEHGPNSEVVETLTMLWLQEIAYGGNQTDEDIQEWLEDDNGVSPNTFGKVIAALKARFRDHTGERWNPSDEAADELQGMRRDLRNFWGKDQRATPLLGRHVTAIATHLAKTAHHTGSPRELLIAELSAAGLSPAEIGRLDSYCLLPADKEVTVKTEEANEELYRATRKVGMKTLVVPGQKRKGGKQDPAKLVVLHEHSTLDQAFGAYHRHTREDRRAKTAQFEQNHRWYIYGFAEQQRSNLMRQVLVDLARKAGSDWTPTRSAPAMPADVLDDVRTMLRNGDIDGTRQKAEIRRAKRDLAMLWVGFYGCLRRSELMALTVGDIVPVEGMHRFVAEIRKSKTDQDGEGVSLVIPGDAEREAHRDPVTVLNEWLVELKEAHGGTLAANTALFPAVEHDASLGQGSMGAQVFSDRLRVLAERAGLKDELQDGGLENVSGHSLRRGYITTAALLGRGPLEIQAQSRHRDINVLARYVESVARKTADVLINVDDLVA